MSNHPLNLIYRFLLELSALVALGWWGWQQSEGLLRVILAIGLPLLAAAAWGTFAVPNDKSRSGKAPIPVPGLIRLLLEFLILFGAAWALNHGGAQNLARVFALAILSHYLLSYDRVLWLLKRR